MEWRKHAILSHACFLKRHRGEIIGVAHSDNRDGPYIWPAKSPEIGLPCLS